MMNGAWRNAVAMRRRNLQPPERVNPNPTGPDALVPATAVCTGPLQLSCLRDNPMASRPFAPGTTFMWMR